ncbi:MAG: NTP transferase domain-containing protein, partial [Fimbriimonadales bacterium]|nr:NTP transferase domain-containing protein [Fimbriimonadales bacterium]
MSETSLSTEIEVYLLAAGRSERLGQCKQLLDWDGKTLLARMVDAFRSAGLICLRVVGRPEDEELAREVHSLGLRYVVNPQAERGMASSILVALEDCRSPWLGLCPADMPLLRTETLLRLGSAVSDSFSIIQPICKGIRRHPVLFKRNLAPEVRAVLEAGGTLRDYLRSAEVYK